MFCRLLLALALSTPLIASCGDDGPEQPTIDGGTTDDRDGDGIPDVDDACPDDPEDFDGVLDDDGCPDPGDNMGSLPTVKAKSGVAYVGHFLSNDLAILRTDGTEPSEETPFDLGTVTHDMVIDDERDLLIVVSDVARNTRIYQLTRPASAATAVTAPTLLSTISFTNRPVIAMVNPYRQRIYIVASPPLPPSGPITEMFVRGFDTSNPASPVELSGSPYTIAVTTSIALDAVRDVMFVVELTTDVLTAYDLQGDGFTTLPGAPIVLTDLYPQENMFSFQARSLVADPFRNRLYAARSQSILSELIVFDYPADIPRDGARYSDFAGLDDLTMVADAFDVDLPGDQRQNLLDAYVPALDLETGNLFMSADTWNGSASTAIVAAFTGTTLALATGCDDFEGFGCFVRSYTSGTPSTFLRTDGATCVDWTHSVVVATSVATKEIDPGQAHFMSYDGALGMSAWLPAGGGNTVIGSLPVSAVCH